MDNKSEFINIVDRAIEVAQRIADNDSGEYQRHTVEDATKVIRIFSNFRDELVEDQIPLFRGGGLGITKGLSEWGVPSELYDVGYEIESFYRNSWTR
jgi:hypothetical protein